jgi:TonB family protein
VALALMLSGPMPTAGADEAAEAPVLTKAPELVESADPLLSEDAKALGGRVVVAIVIEVDGTVRDVELISGFDPAVDDAAVLAARAFLFTPAEVDGVPSSIRIEYTFVFEPPPPEIVLAVLDGFVGDRLTGLPIRDAIVSTGAVEAVARSDPEGRFVLEGLPPGDHSVVVYHSDYERLVQEVTAAEGERVSVEAFLQPSVLTDGETIVFKRRPWREVKRAPLKPDPAPVLGRWTLTRRDIELSPGVMGDAARAIHQLPGVSADSDLFATFHVRGGAASETTFRLEGVPLLSTDHFGGVFTLFNPKLVERMQLYASAPPASVGGGLAGALEIDYVDGDNEQIDGVFDFNLVMVSAFVMGPLGPPGSRGTFVISGRRSLMEAYYGLLRATRLLPSDVDFNIAFGDYLLKVTLHSRDGRHRYRVWGMFAHNRLRLGADPDGDAVLSLRNTIDFGSNTVVVSADWRWNVADRLRWTTRFSFTRDHEDRQQAGDLSITRKIETLRPALRTEAVWTVNEHHAIRLGAELSYLSFGGDGTIKDPRFAPTWAGLPWADLGAEELTFDASTEWGEAVVFLEDEMRSIGGIPLNINLGVRANLLTPTKEILIEPRFGLSVPLPTFTTLKAGFGIVHQWSRDPMVYDPVYGAVNPKAERAFDFSVGIEQLLPFGGLIRIEGYHRVLDRLLVNPDTRAAVAAGGTWESTGSGTASGVDFFYGMRFERFGLAATYSFLVATRTNPLNDAGPKTFHPFFDQRHGVKLGWNTTLGKRKRWIISGMWELRSGRPKTLVTPTLKPSGTSFEVVPYGYNSVEKGPFHELSIRIETHVIAKARVKVTAYLDILNVYFAQSDFIQIYGSGTVPEDGDPVAPEPFTMKQLPIRPWWGIRAEF